MKKIIYILCFLTTTVGLYGQTFADKEKSEGSIDFNSIKLQADLSEYVKNIESREIIHDGNFDKLNFDIKLNNFRGISIDAVDDEGNITFISGEIAELPMAMADADSGERVLQYLRKLEEEKTLDLNYYGFHLEKLKLIEANSSQNGRVHLKYQQYVGEVPVYASELRVHMDGNKVYAINGYTYGEIEAQTAKITARAALQAGYDNVNRLPGQVNPAIVKEDVAELMYYAIDKKETPRLTYKLEIHPRYDEAWIIYVDAVTGEVIDKLDVICKLVPTADGPATAVATDLNGKQRTIHTYGVSNNYVMIDASRPMFKHTSDVVNDPQGAIWTLDAGNTSPSNNDFSLTQVVSSNNKWDNQRTAVSAHYNGAVSYEYFRNTFNRNSIDGSGGTIISIINVSEDDGSGMENAFWNGRAMFYGNGGTYFKPLAGGLDVGGHEMSHGVIQATANLEYRNESGALNESYADVFGAMIDRDNWLIGEEVVKPAFGAPALRNMSNPHNGGTSMNHPGYQPAHYNERYTGSSDNGGVHINSGIVNYAYYFFAEAIGKSKAEQVFYHTLINYLGTRSNFMDMRASVEKACLDLYGQAEKNAASQAFANVGIGSGGSSGGTDGATYQVNPGRDWVYVVNKNANLELFNGNGSSLGIVNQNIRARTKPSVSDDGTVVVYITDQGHIYYHILEFGTQVSLVGDGILLSNEYGEWGNVTISKNGKYVAFVSNYADKQMFVADLVSLDIYQYELYVPTSGSGVKIGTVKYADALAFHHDSQHVFYDAYNELDKTTGGSISYWNIGVIKVIENGQKANGDIQLIMGSLPEGISLGNPALTNNTDGYLAIDIVETNGFFEDYSVGILHIYDNSGYAIATNSILSFPGFDRLDKKLILSTTSTSNSEIIITVPVNKDFNGLGGDPIYFADGYRGVWFADGNRHLVGTEVVYEAEDISVYPNPVETVFTIELKTPATNEVRILLFSESGQLMKEVNVLPGQDKVEVSTENMSAGIYHLNIIDGETLKTKKLIKH